MTSMEEVQTFLTEELERLENEGDTIREKADMVESALTMVQDIVMMEGDE